MRIFIKTRKSNLSMTLYYLVWLSAWMRRMEDRSSYTGETMKRRRMEAGGGSTWWLLYICGYNDHKT